jgi:hypothetical protein
MLLSGRAVTVNFLEFSKYTHPGTFNPANFKTNFNNNTLKSCTHAHTHTHTRMPSPYTLTSALTRS